MGYLAKTCTPSHPFSDVELLLVEQCEILILPGMALKVDCNLRTRPTMVTYILAKP